jgi:hypothetical protein
MPTEWLIGHDWDEYISLKNRKIQVRHSHMQFAIGAFRTVASLVPHSPARDSFGASSLRPRALQSSPKLLHTDNFSSISASTLHVSNTASQMSNHTGGIPAPCKALSSTLLIKRLRVSKLLSRLCSQELGSTAFHHPEVEL